MAKKIIELKDFFRRMHKRVEKEIENIFVNEPDKMIELHTSINLHQYYLRYVFLDDNGGLSIAEKAELPHLGTAFSLLPINTLSYICEQMSEGEYNIIDRPAEGYGRIQMSNNHGETKFVDYCISDYLYSNREFLDISGKIKDKLVNHMTKWEYMGENDHKLYKVILEEPSKVTYMMYGVLHTTYVHEVFTYETLFNKPSGAIYLRIEGESNHILTNVFNKRDILKLLEKI